VTDGDRVEILSGLAPGDRIVIDGADKLRDGAKIVVRSETGAGATTTPAVAPDGKSGGKSGGKKRQPEDGQKQ
jgi:multidrug efflux system membrane fusion protein